MFDLGFQHFPRDLANVNEWKIMFDPSIISDKQFSYMCLESFKMKYLADSLHWLGLLFCVRRGLKNKTPPFFGSPRTLV